MTSFQDNPDWGEQPHINTYLWQSIAVTLLCCLPLGIVAIVFALKASSKQASGDYPGALIAADKAKMFTWASLIIGAFFIIAYIGVKIAVGSSPNS